MNENINVLDEISKGSHMGMDAINFIIEKVQDKKFKKVLLSEYKEYKKISEKIDKIYPKYNNGEPHKTSAITKMMTWYGVEMKTMMDQSNSKIAELMLQGTNMGIIEGKKILNNKKMDKEIHSLVDKYIMMQEDNVETLKEFL